jgi:hypothetical protein
VARRRRLGMGVNIRMIIWMRRRISRRMSRENDQDVYGQEDEDVDESQYEQVR